MSFQQETHEFTLTDRWGESHQYVVILHGAREGTNIAMQLLALIGPTLGGLIKSLFENKGDGSLLDLDIETIGQTIDFSVIGASLKSALMSEEAQPLVMGILRHTSRGVDQLGRPECFDKAYRANYGEAARAVWEVVRINGFFPLLDTFTK